MASVSAVERLENLEKALGEVGSRIRGIHQAERFAQMHPHLAPYVSAYRAEVEAAESKREVTTRRISKDRYRPVTSDNWPS